MSEQCKAAAVTTQTAEQSGVLAKLLVLTFALVIAPLTCYYISRDYIWNGNTTCAAITAVFAANIVLVAYIIVSIMEERQIAEAARLKTVDGTKPETKKTQ